MATFTVTTSADDGAGSLRAAVAAANARAGADVIAFDAAVFDGGSEDLIRLTGGQIEITDGLTIVGGPAGVTITGDAAGDDATLVGGITDVDASLDGEDRLDDNSRIFDATAALTLDGLTLTGGRTTGFSQDGGAVRGTNVTLIDSTVSGNSVTGGRSGWGGIDRGIDGVTLTNSIVLGNAGGDVGQEDLTLTGGNILGGDLFDGEADVGDVTAEEVFAATTEIAPGVRASVLADNGGPTRTIAIRADGPAAGAADQRRFARDAAPDLGAFEGGLKLVGGPGADVLTGGAGDDRICGRGGNDVLRCLAGDDLLHGGQGCDTLKGGVGDDVLYGGEGRDTFVFGQGFGDDEIRDFDAGPHCGQDRMDLRRLGISAASFAEAVSIEQLGKDTLVTIEDHGSILCIGVDGEDPNRVDPADFLLA